MFKWRKTAPSNQPSLTWSAEATAGLEQAISQAPVPALLKGRVKQELMSAAEAAAHDSGHAEVTPQDLMNGLMAKLPANMRQKVEDALQGGPDKLKELEQDLKDQPR